MTIDSPDEHKPLNIDSFRQRLAGKKGKDYWRSLNELTDSDAFDDLVKHEFPRQASLLGDLSRRDFLKVLGASLALAGVTACVPQSPVKILPYVKPPEQLVPGKTIYYASTMIQDGYGKGVLIETTMGRPIKVEGNPSHPDSLGATDAFMQASILELYDPDRQKQVTNQGAESTWADFTTAIGGVMGGLGRGEGLRLLTGPISSPALVDQINALLEKYPQAKWISYSPLGRTNTLAGGTLAYGDRQPSDRVLDLSKADVILSLDCDFLFKEPGHLRYTRDFTARHQPAEGGTMSRLFMVESSATVTGANADHRLAVKPTQVETFARAVASRLGVGGAAPARDVPGQDWLDPLVADLKKAGPAALVVAGERQPAAVHALAMAMNEALGSVGNTIYAIAPVIAASTGGSLQDLVTDLQGGQVQALVILDSNPVYTAPADLNFAEAMKKAQVSVYLAYNPDETAAQATWVIPAAHYMEMWGDALAFDGTVSLVQPVIEPLYNGKAPSEVLAALMGEAGAKSYDLVRARWQGRISGNFERNWREALSKGVLPNSASAPLERLTLSDPAGWTAAAEPAGSGLEIVFEPDETVWDGRFSNNAWQQELPKNLTKLTWDNGVYVAPRTAERLSLKQDDVVTVKLRDRSVDGAVYIQPGQPQDVVVVSLGYGRKAGGNLATGPGYNAYAIRTAAAALV